MFLDASFCVFEDRVWVDCTAPVWSHTCQHTPAPNKNLPMLGSCACYDYDYDYDVV